MAFIIILEALNLKKFCAFLKLLAGKGRNAGGQHFLLFPQCFQKSDVRWLIKGAILC